MATLSASAQDPTSTPTPRQIAERIVEQVVANPFGMSRAEWRKTAPSATWIEFGSNAHNPSAAPRYRWPEGRWCAIAEDHDGTIKRQAIFYAIRASEPLDCRIEQVTYTVAWTADTRIEALYGELVGELSKRIGSGGVAHVDSEEVRREARLGERQALMHWYGENFNALLFTQTLGVGVEIRHSELFRALRTPTTLMSVEATFQDKLRTQLRQVYPEIAEITLLEPGVIRDEARIAKAVKTLLDARDRATSSNDRAWLSLAADQVLVRLHLEGDEPPEQRVALAELRPFGLEFQYQPINNGWDYARGLVEDVIRKYPFNEWAQMALVSKIVHGWDLVHCHDSYQDVIKHGTDWLARNPSSAYRLVVTHAVAQAYETWWSLSKAPDHDEDAQSSREKAKPGSTKARLEAITSYRRVLELMPAGLPVKDLERAMIHLTVDIDTGHRPFHCAID